MKTWKVVVAKPGRKAEIREIPATYKALLDLVGGRIELTEPVSDDTAVICNEEESSWVLSRTAACMTKTVGFSIFTAARSSASARGRMMRISVP